MIIIFIIFASNNEISSSGKNDGDKNIKYFWLREEFANMRQLIAIVCVTIN